MKKLLIIGADSFIGSHLVEYLVKKNLNYVEDTVNSFYRAIKSDKSDGQIINIGSKDNFTINETVKIIQEIIGSKKKLRPTKSEVQLLSADNSKAKRY